MPIGFIILGIALNLVLFYGKQKIIFSFFLVFMLASYFIPCFSTAQCEINITMLLGILMLLIYLLVREKNKMFLFYAVVFNFVYLVIVKFNGNYLTSLNPNIMFVVLVLLGLILNNKTQVLCYIISAFLSLTVTNIFLEQPLEYVVVGNLELITYFIVASVICYFACELKSKLKFLYRRKIWKKYWLFFVD